MESFLEGVRIGALYFAIFETINSLRADGKGTPWLAAASWTLFWVLGGSP